jgi:hypothetical protein
LYGVPTAFIATMVGSTISVVRPASSRLIAGADEWHPFHPVIRADIASRARVWRRHQRVRSIAVAKGECGFLGRKGGRSATA